tara:strand:- start:178 stop:849 length:672 start_codon:yes stop_codon:yes gene_type:complete
MIKVLELFSGTGSVGKVCDLLGWVNLSVDLDGRADITCDILEWDYKQYPKDSFDVIWASPPCASFSALQRSWIGRKRGGKIFTEEVMVKDMEEKGDPIVLKTLEIINYFNPHYWFMENPNTGNLKNRPYMEGLPFYVVDYCMYSDWGYRKRTRIWTNKEGWEPLTCDGKGTCGNMIGTLHKTNLGNTDRFKRANLANVEKYNGTSLDDRYRIPEKLILSLFTE